MTLRKAPVEVVKPIMIAPIRNREISKNFKTTYEKIGQDRHTKTRHILTSPSILSCAIRCLPPSLPPSPSLPSSLPHPPSPPSFPLPLPRSIYRLLSPSAGLDIGLVGPVARGASRFENLLAPQKTYWPPKKLTGPPKK